MDFWPPKSKRLVRRNLVTIERMLVDLVKSYVARIDSTICSYIFFNKRIDYF